MTTMSNFSEISQASESEAQARAEKLAGVLSVSEAVAVSKLRMEKAAAEFAKQPSPDNWNAMIVEMRVRQILHHSKW